MQLTFDEQLRVTLDGLGDRLREHVGRELETALQALDRAAHDDLQRTLAEARANVERTAVATREDVERAVVERIAAAVADADRSAETRLASAVAEAKRQAEEQLAVAVAGAETRGEQRGRQQGQDEGRRQATPAPPSAEAIESAVAAARKEVVDTFAASRDRMATSLRSLDRAKALTEILDRLMSFARRETPRVALMIVAGGRLRAWRFAGFNDALDANRTLEIPLEDGGVMAEAVREKAPITAELIGAPSFAVPPPRRDSYAVPITIAGQVVAVLYADQGASAARSADHPDAIDAGHHTSKSGPSEAWTAPIEVLARHAARCLEVRTAFKAARALVAQANGGGNALASPEAPVADAEEAARRYARLLVSEIKLYHEPEVSAGRRDRDLTSRLGGEIARARVLYEQRVAPQVRQRADFFQDELVRTLADGDASLLEIST